VALRVLKWVGVVLGVGVLVLVGLALWRASTAGLASNAEPVTDYDGDRETGEIGSVSHLRGSRREEARPLRRQGG
jgi:hypothetical protein